MKSSEYFEALLPYATKAAPNELTAISEFLKRHQIKWVFHFTHFSNLVSIFQNGILSREKLTENDVQFTPTDSSRADGLLSGTSLSISFPNRWMLQRKIESMGGNFAVIEISANALLNKRIVAFPSNAARREFERLVISEPSNFVGARGLSNLFLNNEVRKKNRLGPEMPTDMQSELMIFDSIEVHTLRGIHLPEFMSPEFTLAVNELRILDPVVGIDYPCRHSYFTDEFPEKNKFKEHDGRYWQPDWK
jgi:hypothetical protein